MLRLFVGKDEASLPPSFFRDFFPNSMQAKAVYLHPKEFSIEAGELTPTQKLVRRKIEVLFATQIEEMYKSLP